MRITLRLLFDLYLGGIFSLFPIVIPFGAIPLFLTLTARLDAAGRRRVAPCPADSRISASTTSS